MYKYKHSNIDYKKARIARIERKLKLSKMTKEEKAKFKAKEKEEKAKFKAKLKETKKKK
jgi:hypothetical protein